MEKVKKIIKSRYTLLTLIIIAMYVIYLAMAKIIPFGKNSILIGDSFQQYATFFSYFREVLLHSKSILVSWNLGLANSFLGTFTYYLTSPLNLLVVFFTTEKMYLFVELLILIKIILIGNSMVLFLSKSYHYKSYNSILFGIMYAFSSYVVCYGFQNVMWLDAVYMLPIVLLLVDNYQQKNKIYPYTMALSVTLFMNYYTGFMVAFFSGIYYLAKYYCQIEGKIFTKENIKHFLKHLLKFLLGILVAFGMIMIIFIPAINQVNGNFQTDEIQMLDINKEKLELFSNVIFNNYNYIFAKEVGLIFTGSLVVLLLPMYYGNTKIKRREKIAFSCVVIFLLLPILSPVLNIVWHGFSMPHGFPNRYLFTLIFMLLLMTFRTYSNRKYMKKKYLWISLITFTFLTAVELAVKNKGDFRIQNQEIGYLSIFLSYLILLMMWGILWFNLRIKAQKLSNILLLGIVIIDLLVGARSGIRTNEYKYSKLENVLEHDIAIKELIKDIPNKETNRIAFVPQNYRYARNLSLKYSYSDISFFTSAINKKTIGNMYLLGYNTEKAMNSWVTSLSGTYLNYTLAGVKYYITQKPLEENELYGFVLIKQVDNYYLYENQYTLPFGYWINDNQLQGENPFEKQNEILNNMLEGRENTDYLVSIEKENNLVNCKKIKIVDNEEEIRWKYEITGLKDTNLYFHSDWWDIQLYKEGEAQFENYYGHVWSIDTGIKGIKHLNAGEDYEFEISCKKESYYLDHEIYVYATDNQAIQEVIQEVNVRQSNLEIKEVKSNYIEGNINITQTGYITLPIAYDEGWRATVNGESVNVEWIGKVFTGIKLEPGNYEMHLYFIPLGLKKGCLITGISFLILITIILLEERIIITKKLNKKIYNNKK